MTKEERKVYMHNWQMAHKAERNERARQNHREHKERDRLKRQTRAKDVGFDAGNIRKYYKRRGLNITKDIELHHFNYDFRYSVIVMTKAAHCSMHGLLERCGHSFKYVVSGTIVDDPDTALVLAQQFDPNAYLLQE